MDYNIDYSLVKPVAKPICRQFALAHAQTADACDAAHPPPYPMIHHRVPDPLNCRCAHLRTTVLPSHL